ncbi:MAG: hypothetical protein MUC62_03620 [Candidatus Thermoplasmatota archaeon]|jgi:hypothetical protein|nr:hypothetical protein [Candidatus Thermoplasmatota archaeon]
MRVMTIVITMTFVCLALAGMLSIEGEGARTWESKHIYSGQWLFFEVGNLDKGVEIEYGVKVTTPDESVNLAFMDSTNYAAFSSSVGETFVGQDVQYQVRSREAKWTTPYQQQWYFVAISDSGYEIDIDYYVEAKEDSTDVACLGSIFAGVLILLAVTVAVSYLRK